MIVGRNNAKAYAGSAELHEEDQERLGEVDRGIQEVEKHVEVGMWVFQRLAEELPLERLSEAGGVFLYRVHKPFSLICC